jgi:hypothetical protein
MSEATQVNKSIDELIEDEDLNLEEPVEQPIQQGRGFSFTIPEWLKADTGPGEVEDYLTHTLNHKRSYAMARIIRGATGMFGSLNKAAIDIVLGLFQMNNEKPAMVQRPMGVSQHD